MSGLYTDIIKDKETLNNRYESDADQALLENRQVAQKDMAKQFQSALDLILGKYGVHSEKNEQLKDPMDILDSRLGTLGIMYDRISTERAALRQYGNYAILLDAEGKVYVLSPGKTLIRMSDRKKVPFFKAPEFQENGYGVPRPVETDPFNFGRFVLYALKQLTVKDLVPILLSMLLISLLGLVGPRVNRWVLSDFVESGQMKGFVFAGILFLSAGFLRAAFSAIKTILFSSLKLRISMQTQNVIVSRTLLLPHKVQKNISSGKLSKRISAGRRVTSMILDLFLGSSLTAVFSIVYIGQMGQFSAALVTPALLMLLLKIVIALITSMANAQNEKNALLNGMESSRFLLMSIKGIQKIKGAGAEKRFYGRWAEIYRKMLIYRLDQPFLVKMEQVILSFVTAATTVVILSVAYPAEVTAADYIAFTNSYAFVVTAVGEILSMLDSIFLVWTLFGQVKPLFEGELESKGGEVYLDKLDGKIQLEKVSFHYPGSPRNCVKDISLTIPSGEKLAIVGESGCGKSTLLKLLLGLETADAGRISYDERSLEEINLRSLRKKIATLLQSTALMPGTIFSNIAFNHPGITEEEAWEAAEKACIAEAIRKLPLGLYTEISEAESNGFSGGQKQRILLSRIFASKAGVMIFDEATSALDNITQKKVLDAVYKERSTVIMVAHRLSTVVNCDRILMLEKGSIVESGTYDELMAKDQKFAALVRKQLQESAK